MVSEPPVRIRHSGDLFEVLSSGSLGARLAVLADIQRDPGKALALGPHQGEDFVDLLVRLIPESARPLRKLQTLCLMGFDDPRASEFLTEEFARCKDAATVLRLAQRLTMDRGAEFFLPFLWQKRAAQALAAARICASWGQLSSAERLRIAILLDRPREPPPITEETVDLWMQELTGHHRHRARELAEARQAECLLLWRHWEKLGQDHQEWLLGLTERLDPTRARERVAGLLQSGDVSAAVASSALRLGLDLPRALLSSGHADTRAIAVAAGLADQKLEALLSQESAASVLGPGSALRQRPVGRAVG